MAQPDTPQTPWKTCLFGGFQKSEVLSYVDTLRSENLARTEALEEQLREISAARTALTAQISDFSEKISDMEQQLTEKKEHIEELTVEASSLRDEISHTKAGTIEQDRALALTREQNRQLTLRAQVYEQKAQRYDDLSGQLGDVLLQAHQSAEEILQTAHQNADTIQQEAVETTAKITAQVQSMHDDLAAVRQNITLLMESFCERVDAIDAMLGKLSPENHLAAASEGEEKIPSAEPTVETPIPPCPHAAENTALPKDYLQKTTAFFRHRAK